MLNVYTIYDEKAAAFLPPFCQATDGVAIRNFVASAQDTQSAIGAFPTDFTLFRIGSFDEDTAVFHMLEAKRSFGTALEHLQKEKVRNGALIERRDSDPYNAVGTAVKREIVEREARGRNNGET